MTKKQPKRRKAKPIRKYYMRRLIREIRKSIRNAPENIEATKYMPGAISIRWLNIDLLCDVVEEDLLKAKK